MSELIRTFDLMNGEGESYTLTVAYKYNGFLSTASGLGFNKSPKYQKIGNEYEELTSDINQSTIDGEIRFFNPHAYQAFSRFALFCQSPKMTLYYRIPTGLFKKDGSITKIEKSEGGDNLKCKIQFTATTLWYKEFELDTSGNTMSISSDSVVESPCHIKFTPTNTITALSWSQSLDNNVIVTGTLNNISVSPSESLHIRTDTNPYQIYKISNGSKVDLYSKSDFSTSRFILLEKGLNVITFSTSGDIEIEGKTLYETV